MYYNILVNKKYIKTGGHKNDTYNIKTGKTR